MFNLQSILKNNFPVSDGVLNCLGEEVFTDKIKKQEVTTYSTRGEKFVDNSMLYISEEENHLLDPLRKLPAGSVILELAGGNGRFAIQLAREGYQIIESDIAPGSVSKVKQVAEANNISNLNYAAIDAENLPFLDNSLDGVFMVASLHHLPNPKKALLEIKRVLKPGSPLLILREPASWQYYIFLPIFWLLRKLLRRKNQNEFSLADDVTYGFSKRKIKKLLGTDFENLKMQPVHYLRKFYTNWLILKSKFTKKSYTGKPGIINCLKKLDKLIAKIPLFRSLPWDWDIYCQTSQD